MHLSGAHNGLVAGSSPAGPINDFNLPHVTTSPIFGEQKGER
jgi:hypothetical protein